jgi:hypothetical protein
MPASGQEPPEPELVDVELVLVEVVALELVVELSV